MGCYEVHCKFFRPNSLKLGYYRVLKFRFLAIFVMQKKTRPRSRDKLSYDVILFANYYDSIWKETVTAEQNKCDKHCFINSCDL